MVLGVATQAQIVGNYGVDGFLPGALPVGVTSTRYHAQDELGQARFGYAHPGQAATNYRDALGNQIGSYAYFNPEGKEVRVSYTADSRGFRVLSNDLPVAPVAPVANLVAPVPVQDTPEVAAAKATHMAALAAARTPKVTPAAPAAPAAPAVSAAPLSIVSEPVAPSAAPVANLVAPLPVQDTPEVAAAKRQHAIDWNAAKAATDAANFRNYYAGAPSAYNYGFPLAYNYGSPVAYNMPYYPHTPYTYGSPTFHRGITYV